jgi:hypothetical protein
MSQPRSFPLHFPLIVFATKDVADVKTGLHSYEGFITLDVPEKGDCLPVFESGTAVQDFFGERPDLHGVLFEQKADLLLLLSAIQENAIEWVAVNPGGEPDQGRFHRITELLEQP